MSAIDTKTDSEIVAMVRHGGGAAFTGMGYIIGDRRDYPGDVDDVFNLLGDTVPISFSYTPADLAQAYLFDQGLIKESDLADRWQVEELVKYYSLPPAIGGNEGLGESQIPTA